MSLHDDLETDDSDFTMRNPPNKTWDFSSNIIQHRRFPNQKKLP